MANGGRRVKFTCGGAYAAACPAGIMLWWIML